MRRWLDYRPCPACPACPARRAADAIVEHPFNPLGRVDEFVIHDTSDPEIIVAEFTYRGTMVRDRPVTRRNVFVMTGRNGAVVASRDYQADAH